MLKPLLLLCVTANIFFVAAVKGREIVSSSDRDHEKHQHRYNNADAEGKVAWANTALTAKLLYNHLLKNPGQSHSVAAMPILGLIVQAALHLEREKFQEFAQWFNLNSKYEIEQTFPTIMKKLHNDTKIDLAFIMFTNKRLSTEFTHIFKRILDGDVKYVDICNNTNSINYWFQKQHEGPSGDIVDSDYLTNNLEGGLVFGNYMAAKVSWDHPFNPTGLTEIKFHKSKHEVQTLVALYGNAFARYAELPQLKAKMLLLSSTGVQNSIGWLYPNDPDDLLSLLYKIQDPSVFYGALSQLRASCLKLYVTTGKSHSVNRYSKCNPELNLDLSGLNRVYNEKNKPAHIFSIIQQLRLIADSVVTNGSINSPVCPDHDYPLVRFDHPFVYFSLNEFNSPVFAGVYYGH